MSIEDLQNLIDRYEGVTPTAPTARPTAPAQEPRMQGFLHRLLNIVRIPEFVVGETIGKELFPEYKKPGEGGVWERGLKAVTRAAAGYQPTGVFEIAYEETKPDLKPEDAYWKNVAKEFGSRMFATAASIAFDPITYTPAGVFVKPLKAVGKIKPVAKAVTKIKGGAVYRGAAKIFTKYGARPLGVPQKTWGALVEAKDTLSRQIRGRVDEYIDKQLRPWAAKLSGTEDKALARQVLDGAAERIKAGDKIGEVVSQMDTHLKQIGNIEKEMSALGSMLEDYYPRVISKEFRNAIGEINATIAEQLELHNLGAHMTNLDDINAMLLAAGKEPIEVGGQLGRQVNEYITQFKPQFKSSIRRRLKGTTDEINTAFKTKYGFPLFEEDPLIAISVRTIRHITDVAKIEFIDNLVAKGVTRQLGLKELGKIDLAGSIMGIEGVLPNSKIFSFGRDIRDINALATLVAAKNANIVGTKAAYSGMLKEAEMPTIKAIESLRNSIAKIKRDKLLTREDLSLMDSFITDARNFGLMSEPEVIKKLIKRKEIRKSYKNLNQAQQGFKKIIALYEEELKHGRTVAAKNLNKQLRDVIHYYNPMIKQVEKARYFIAPAEVADMLKMQRFVDKDVQGLMQHFYGALNVWKMYATLPNLGFHIRNWTGNNFNLYLHHGRDILMPKGLAARKLARQWFKGKSINIGKYTDREIRAAIRDGALLRTGFVGGDVYQKAVDVVGQLTTGKFGKTSFNPLSRRFVLHQIGGKLGEHIEDHAKVFSVLLDLKKGKTLKEAVDNARKFLFDYADLSAVEKSHFRFIAPFYCVPDDCEILTNNGWKKRWDIQPEDKALTYNLKKDYMEWGEIEGVAVFPYNGQLMQLKNKFVDFLATPNHKWPIFDHKEKRRLEKFYDIRSNHKIPIVREYKAPIDGIDKDTAALLGWILTDGYHRWRGNHCEIMIYQKKYCKEVESLLINYSKVIHPDTGVFQYRIRGKQREKFAVLLKQNPFTLVSGMSKESLEAMWNAMILAEGHIEKSKKFIHFAQNKGRVLDLFQIISYLIGKPAHLSNRGCYVKTKTFIMAHGIIGTQWYTGNVWCPTTPNGTWVMRRNGKVIITGNTWARKNLPLQVEQLLVNPKRYVGISKLFRMVQGKETPQETKYRPQYFKELSMMKVFFKDPTSGRSLFWYPNIPQQEFEKYTSLKDLLSSLNPMLKVPVELAAGQEFFTKRRLDIPREAPGLMTVFPKPIQRLLGVTARKGKKYVPARAAYAISQVPFLKNIGDIINFAKGGDTRFGWKVMSSQAGMKFTPVELDKWKTWYRWQTAKEKAEKRRLRRYKGV